MKQTIVILFLFVIKSPPVFSQLNNPAFFVKKKIIDSITLSIDNNQSILMQRVIGIDSLLGAYKGMIYYTTAVKKPDKINYDFELDSSGSKVFYYKDGLIKILDKGMSLYYINGILLTGNGFVIDPLSTKNLLHFEVTTSNSFLQLFDKN